MYSAILLFATLLFVSAFNVALCVRDTKYYDILGIPPDSTQRDIKKAYRKAAMKWHPDRNDDNKEEAEQKFKEIANAYEVLSDDEKRKVYGQYGEEGLQGEAGGSGFEFHGDPFEMFKDFFGDSNPFEGMGAGGTHSVHIEFEGDAGFEDIFGGGGFQFDGGFGNMGGFDMGSAFEGFADAFGGGGFSGFGGEETVRPEYLYAADPYVAELDASEFPKTWSSSVYLVHFYSTQQKGGSEAVSAIKKVAASFVKSKAKNLLVVAGVNCDVEEELCSTHAADNVPSVQVIVPESQSVHRYEGERTAAKIKQWATSLIPSYAQNITDTDTLQSLLHTCGSASKGSLRFGLKRASWDLCVLLLTDKEAVTPLYAGLSGQFRGQASFGQVHTKYTDVASYLESGEVPALFAVCNGDLSAVQMYEGDMTFEALHSFISQYSGGKRCRKEVKLDTVSLPTLRVGQLKAILSDHGLRCRHCLERSDYVQFITEQLIQS